jgi:hypothetical protein
MLRHHACYLKKDSKKKASAQWADAPCCHLLIKTVATLLRDMSLLRHTVLNYRYFMTKVAHSADG